MTVKLKEEKMLLHVRSKGMRRGDVIPPFERYGYVCMAFSIRHAAYWAFKLYCCDGCRQEREGSGFEVNLTLADLAVYEVEVLGDGMVEDCVGHLAFQQPGVPCHAHDVRPHPEPSSLFFGEVVSRNPVRVRGVLDVDLESEVERISDQFDEMILSRDI